MWKTTTPGVNLLISLSIVVLFVLLFGIEAWDLFWVKLRERHSQVGSLAGAAHLLNDNTGVLREAQWEQKSHVEQKGKSFFDFDFQYEYKLWKHGLSIL